MRGTGTSVDPYIIENLTDLNNVRNDLDAYYRLDNNIDASETFYWNGGAGWEPIQDFTGNFNGNGYEIRNLRINRPTEDNTGLIGRLLGPGTIYKVRMININYTCRDYCGGVVGAIAGGCSIYDLYVTGSANARSYFGGVVGNSAGSDRYTLAYISRAQSAVYVDSNGGSSVGGIVGHANYTTIEDCVNTGRLWPTRGSYNAGICGYASSYVTLNKCLNTGAINNNGGATTNCFPVVGNLSAGYMCYAFNCFYNNQTSLRTQSTSGITSISSAQCRTASTFTKAGWDFVNTWRMRNGRPELITIDAKPDRVAATIVVPRGVINITPNSVLVGPSINTSPPKATLTVIGSNPSVGAEATIYPSRGTINVYGRQPISFSGKGSGTSEDPYQIANLQQLNEIRNNPSSYYVLVNDIDASPTSAWNGGAGWSPIVEFTGNINGNGHVIKGLYINRPLTDYNALFGTALTGSVITRIFMQDVNIVGKKYNGALVGLSTGATISFCASSGQVNSTGNNSGGLVGTLGPGSSIDQCFSLVNLTATTSATGGLIGHADQATVSNCYAKGTVDGVPSVAGFIGSASDCTITNCYSVGAVTGTTGTYSRGFIGYGIRNTVTSCYWDKETSGKTNSFGGTGKTTAEMKTAATYVGWQTGIAVNLALGKTYTKSIAPSASYPDTGNLEATDGLLSAAYNDGRCYAYNITSVSAKVTVDVRVDLGSNQLINSCRTWFSSGNVANYKPNLVTIYTSTDDSTYTLQGSTSTLTNQWYTVNFSAVTARYVRFRFEKTRTGAKDDWMFLDEVEVYGPTPPAIWNISDGSYPSLAEITEAQLSSFSSYANIEVSRGTINLYGSNLLAGIEANISVGRAIINLSGSNPTVSGAANVVAPAGTINVSGKDPTISAGVNIFSPCATIGIGGGSSIATGAANVNPLVGNISIHGNNPLLETINAIVINVPRATIGVGGYAPTIKAGATISPSIGTISISSKIPTPGAGATIQPVRGTITINGIEPLVSRSVNIYPNTGIINVIGKTPWIYFPYRTSIIVVNFIESPSSISVTENSSSLSVKETSSVITIKESESIMSVKENPTTLEVLE